MSNNQTTCIHWDPNQSLLDGMDHHGLHIVTMANWFRHFIHIYHVLFLVPDDLILLLFKLPRSHKPGEDRISKFRARHQSTVDMIASSWLGVNEGTYTSTNTTFTDGTEWDVLYIPQSSAIPSLPPVIIEFQHSVTKSFMCRSIQHRNRSLGRPHNIKNMLYRKGYNDRHH